jgi:hypothetical protein
MNTFYEHHQDSIRFGDRCFDRIRLHGLVQSFQRPERVVGFFTKDRQLSPVSKPVLKDIARPYDHWVAARAKAWDAPIIEPPMTGGATSSSSPTSGGRRPIGSLSS